MVVTRSRGAGQGPRADAALAVLILVLGTFLAWSGAQLSQRLHASAARRQSLSFEDHIGLAANTTGLIVVVWWVLSFLIALASALLERSGSRRAAAAAGKFSPAFMRRLALAAVGLQLAAAPLAHASSGPSDPSGQATAPPSAIAAAWVPSSGTLAAGHTVPQTMAVPAPEPQAPSPGPRGPGLPGRGLRSVGPPAVGVDPHWTPAPVPVDPGTLATVPQREQASAEVTVRMGDSLWSICATALGPLASDLDVALAWPRLYQVNREVIGPDPGLLLPGQILKMPVGL